MTCHKCGNLIRNPLNYCPYCREPLNNILPPLIEGRRQKRKPGGKILFLLGLLLIGFAVYYYKGPEVLLKIRELPAFLGSLRSRNQNNAMSPGAAGSAANGSGDGMVPVPTAPAQPKPSETYTDPATGMVFVFVPGGCYRMGDQFGDGDADEKPVHEVCINDFYISRNEVTQGQWEALMGKNPASVKGGKNDPVDRISWQATQNFLTSLRSKNNTSRFRLPTEAEWEYACRSGGKAEKWAGTSIEKTLGEYAWTASNSGGKPHQTGSAKPNGLGLFDMSGNIWEWVEDDYAPDCYQDQERDNPLCIRGGNRVIRGGSMHLSERFARCTARGSARPSEGPYSVGFRLVREK
jgi:formylglycine-generating enzyme required for sulfatase activity